MRRRNFLIAAALASLPVLAQQAKRVGVLLPYLESDNEGGPHFAAFVDALAKQGWKDRANLRLDVRWAGADPAKITASAKTLVAGKPDAVFVRTTAATLALVRETRTLPIVFVSVTDPVGDGIVQALARPGGNATGFTNFEDSHIGKWIEFLREFDPRIGRIALVASAKHAARGGKFFTSALEKALAATGLKAVAVDAGSAGQLEAGLAAFAREPNGAVLMLPDAMTLQLRRVIIDQAQRHRLPALYPNIVAVREGGLMAYSAEPGVIHRQAAAYVDRILRGAKAADLPVQAPTKFELVLNRNAARAIGRDIPSRLALRADEVIE